MFKGIYIDDEEKCFIKGDKVISRKKTYIHPHYNNVEVKNDIANNVILYEVQPETVCKKINITDKNGKDIYEHDIVKATDGNYYEIIWNNDAAMYFKYFINDELIKGRIIDGISFADYNYIIFSADYEIVGNRYSTGLLPFVNRS